MARAYLDHASSSPLRPAALEAMLPYLREHHADPGRLHAEGHTTRVAIEAAREQVAARFGARPREVVFTASGTEAVNTAVWGALARAGGDAAHVVTTAVEHSSVLDSVRRGASDVTVVGVDHVGRFDPVEVVAAIRSDTGLVAVQLANHEVGTLQPAAAVVEGRARARGHDPRRRVRGRRTRRRRLRRAGRGPLFDHRPQVRRTEGCRRPAGAARPAVPAVRRGRRPGAGPARRDRERARHRGLRRGGERSGRRRGTRTRARRSAWRGRR